MHRRRVLSLAGAAALAGTAGCARFGLDGRTGDVSQVEAPDLELAPGSEATLTVWAPDVTELRVGMRLSDAEDGELEFDVESVDPEPDDTGLSYPPTWMWDSPTTVRVDVAVAAAESSTAAEYGYVVRAAVADEEEPIVREGTVTVTE